MSSDDRYLAPDDPLVRAVAQPEERVLPPLEVLDWWEHPGEEGRTTPSGLVAVPRQLALTTQRILVLRDGSIERSVALESIGGAEIIEPSGSLRKLRRRPRVLGGRRVQTLPLEASELAVLVRSYDEPPVVWGCWSAASEEAHRLMGDIFQLSHGLPLGP